MTIKINTGSCSTCLFPLVSFEALINLSISNYSHSFESATRDSFGDHCKGGGIHTGQPQNQLTLEPIFVLGDRGTGEQILHLVEKGFKHQKPHICVFQEHHSLLISRNTNRQFILTSPPPKKKPGEGGHYGHLYFFDTPTDPLINNSNQNGREIQTMGQQLIKSRDCKPKWQGRNK